MHGLILCNEVIKVCDSILAWWGFGSADSFSLVDLFHDEGGNVFHVRRKG